MGIDKLKLSAMKINDKMDTFARVTGNNDDKIEITWGLHAARVNITDKFGQDTDIIIDRELAMNMFEWVSEQMNNY